MELYWGSFLGIIWRPTFWMFGVFPIVNILLILIASFRFLTWIPFQLRIICLFFSKDLFRILIYRAVKILLLVVLGLLNVHIKSPLKKVKWTGRGNMWLPKDNCPSFSIKIKKSFKPLIPFYFRNEVSKKKPSKKHFLQKRDGAMLQLVKVRPLVAPGSNYSSSWIFMLALCWTVPVGLALALH